MVAKLLNSTVGLVGNTVGGVGNLVGGLLGTSGQNATSGPGKSGSAPGHTGAAPGLSHASKDLTEGVLKDNFEQHAPPPKVELKGDEKKEAKEIEKDAEKDAKQGGGTVDPAGPPEVVGRKGPAGKTPWISQFDPVGKDSTYSNGEQNCGPAVAAAVARNVGYGKELTDAQLIMHLGQAGGTSNQGTSGNGMIAMYNEMGMDTNATAGANLDWMKAELQAGHHVNVLGDYYEVPGRVDGAQTAGHYLGVTGMTLDGSFLVNDPADPSVTQLTAAQLQNFITSGPQGGFAISAWNPIGAPVAG